MEDEYYKSIRNYMTKHPEDSQYTLLEDGSISMTLEYRERNDYPKLNENTKMYMTDTQDGYITLDIEGEHKASYRLPSINIESQGDSNAFETPKGVSIFNKETKRDKQY